MKNEAMEERISRLSADYIYQQAVGSLLLTLMSAMEDAQKGTAGLPYEVPEDALRIKKKTQEYLLELKDLLDGSAEARMAAFEDCGGGEDPHYAAALNSLAGFLYGAGDYERAIETYQKAAAYTKRWFGENVEYAVTFQNMSWACQSMGRNAEARHCLTEAERVLTALFGADHERTQAVRDALRRLEGAAS